jgi:hypothetical protein
MLLTGLLWLAPSPISLADSDSRYSTMADAMLKMMDAMRFRGGERTGTGGTPWGAFAGSAPSWNGAYPQDMMNRWSRGAWPHRSASAAAHLNGVWLSESGERLTIRAGRFRLQAGSDRVTDGVLQVRGRRLALHQPRLNRTWIYEFAEHEGRLALRDAQGQVFLYRRIGG